MNNPKYYCDKDNVSSSCALVISSCDKYQDLWMPYFNLLFSNWSDCPFKIFLISNNISFDHPRVTTLLTGDDASWSHQLRTALNQLNFNYILLTLEDFFLREAVNTKEIINAVNILYLLNGNMLRLVPMPPPNEVLMKTDNIGVINSGAQYRVSTQASIWLRKELLAILDDEESIWEFELKGSRRSDNRPGYYSYWKSVFPYKHHVIERGKWFRNEAKKFGSLNIGCDFKKRKIMNIYEMTKWRITYGTNIALRIFPTRLELMIRRYVRHLLS